MSESATKSIFQDVVCIDDVASLLGTSAKQVRFLLYVVPENKRYTIFEISKRTGGTRTIRAPIKELKAIQRRLAEFLQDRVVLRPAAHGFTREKSIVTNAQLHANHRAVLNIDLKDFFPTINFGRVRGLFMARPFGACPKVATVLAQICCHDGALPQGAPSSPVISNMICSRMDAQLLRLASSHQCVYTRYADDMTFSKRKGTLPSDLAVVSGDGKLVAGKSVREIVEQNGFLIHPTKVHLHHNTTRQIVTGLTVNSGVNVPREFVRDIRAMIHDWRTNGLEAAEMRHHTEFYHHPSRLDPGPPLHMIIEGKLNFLGMVRGIDHPVRKNLQRQFANVWPKYLEIMRKEDEEMQMSDFFISHASEDKEDFVRPLADALIKMGVSVWYDEYVLTIGDDLYQKICEGLRSSRYGIVVLSPSFFDVKKTWPVREVSAILALEDSDKRPRALPIWHNVDQPTVAYYSPLLAGKYAIRSTDFTPEQLAIKLREFIKSRGK